MRFNVIGHITSEIGLGIMAADYIRALDALGYAVAGYDVDPELGRKGRDRSLERFLRDRNGMYRDGVDICIFPINVAEHFGTNYIFGTRRIAVPLWELPDVNPRWLRGLRHFDGVVSPSDFIYDTLTRAGVEMWRGQHPHYIDDAPAADRAAFGLPDDRIVFTFAFDPSSDVRRKNPQAVVEAFQRANVPNGLLCIQCNRSVERFPDLDRWLATLPPDRVKIINRHLSHREAVQLIASSDVYVSLHRAEGLGLGMLEAMQVGRPVIATAWSGNLSFMDWGSACLVPAEIVPLNGSIPAYTQHEIGAATVWAEPSIDAAAQHMARLATDGEWRRQMSAAALARAEDYQAQARRLEWIAQIPDKSNPAARRQRYTDKSRVLIFTPTWLDEATGEDAIRPEIEAAVKSQQICGQFDWHITTDNPFPVGDYRNVLHQYQKAREYFLLGHWDALLTLEHDNLLPDADALQRLLDTPGDIVYAPYLLRHGLRVLSTWQYINDRNLGMSLSNYPRQLKMARQAIVYRVSGAGFGCTLIRRRVLEALDFTGASPRDKNHCPDLRFAQDALRKGFLSNGRFDVPVMHWHVGAWLHPFANRRNSMLQYLALETMNAIAADRHVRLVANQLIELTEEEADVLQRIGVIQVMAPPPPVQADVPATGALQEVEIVAPGRRRARKANA